jgi:hypothetical protein
MHKSAMDWLKRIRSEHYFEAPVLEIGSIDINGSPRELWGNLHPYVGVDIVSGKNVDYVVDIREFDQFPPDDYYLTKPFHTIICTEVLEHVDPESIINAMWKFMHDTTKVVITCAGLNRAIHSADGGQLKPNEYYENVDPDKLLEWLSNTPENISVVDIQVFASSWAMDDVYAFAVYKVK